MLDTYRKLWQLLNGHERRRAVLLGVLILFMGLAEAIGVASVLPFIAVLNSPQMIERDARLSALRDWTGYHDTMDFLTFLGVAMFLLIVFSLVVKAAGTYATIRFASMRGYSLSSRLLSGYLSLPYSWFLGRHSATLGRTVLNEVELVVNSMLLPALKLLTQGAVILFLVGLLLIADPVAALLAATLLGGAYAAIFTTLRHRMLHYGRVRLNANTARFKTANEALGGIKDLKILGMTQAAADRFRPHARRMADANAAGSLMGMLPRFALEAVVFGGMLLFALALMSQGQEAVQTAMPLLGLYAFAGARLFPALQGFYWAMAQLRSGTAALDALHEDLEQTRRLGEPQPSGPPPAPLGLEDRLELRGVRYAYPNTDRSALQGLDLSVPALSSAGIVGSSGAGKTTALDVMLGLLDPQEGALTVDGVPVGPANRRAWQATVGYVPQQIFLVDDTVAANIAFGVDPQKIDMEAVERAARMAELHRFVTEEMPEGYKTLVGERGVRLSGGQRQRIGIARALYRDPDVLFLDEATAALDNLTERAVMEAVANLGGRKTVVMIAHRLSTVRNCDVIFLMDKGKVTARGRYDDLIANSESFREMAQGMG